MSVESKIQSYFGELEHNKHHRYRSWEHCYQFFQGNKPSILLRHQKEAALQLGFFLASWGMYRKSFLLQCAYTAHLDAIECLANPRWSRLWQSEFGSGKD